MLNLKYSILKQLHHIKIVPLFCLKIYIYIFFNDSFKRNTNKYSKECVCGAVEVAVLGAGEVASV